MIIIKLLVVILSVISFSFAEEDLDFLFDTSTEQTTEHRKKESPKKENFPENTQINKTLEQKNQNNFGKQEEKSVNTESQNTENNVEIYDYGFQLEDDSWMDKYFLIERINLLLILANHIKDLGITLEQLEQIRSFYEEYHPVMVSKAKSVASKEEELKDLILKGGDPRKIKELVIVIAKLKAELTVYNIKMIRVIQNTLTKDQYENLLTLYQKSII